MQISVIAQGGTYLSRMYHVTHMAHLLRLSVSVLVGVVGEMRVANAPNLQPIRTKRDIVGDTFTLLANSLGLPSVDLADFVKQVAETDRAAVHEALPRPINELCDDARFIKARVD